MRSLWRRPRIRLPSKRRIVLGLLAVFLILPQTDTFRLSPGAATASEYLFSVAGWEVANVPYKWYQLLLDALPGREPSREERLASLDRYLQLSRMVRKEKDRLEGLAFRSGSTLATGGVRERAERSTDYLDELTLEKEATRAKGHTQGNPRPREERNPRRLDARGKGFIYNLSWQGSRCWAHTGNHR